MNGLFDPRQILSDIRAARREGAVHTEGAAERRWAVHGPLKCMERESDRETSGCREERHRGARDEG